MTIEKLREEYGDEPIIIEGEAFNDAIIGVTSDDRVVYDYTLMVMSLMAHDKMTVEEASEYVDYNVIRALPYIANGPIVMFLELEDN